MANTDVNKELAAVLGYLVGRPLRLHEILDALGMSKSTYYNQRDEGRLTSPGNLVRVARGLEINEVDLLLRYGFIREQAVIDCAEWLNAQQSRAAAPPHTATEVKVTI